MEMEIQREEVAGEGEKEECSVRQRWEFSLEVV